MIGGEPNWWYGAASDGWQSRLLSPLGALFGAITSRRMRQAPTYRARVPVVCIGNFTAGGTGKTPVVAAVCELLCAQGHTPVVLSRGYGGSVAGPRWVDPAVDGAARVGDEPLLLAARLSVLVSRNRALGGRAIDAAATPRATVIVMDDGIQNPALAKDLTIAVVDAVRGLGNGACIPAGPLRASLKAQLPRVDAVLLNYGGDGANLHASTRAIFAGFQGAILSATIEPAGGAGWLPGARVIAYAGIGVPARFFATVEACGGVIANRVAFADHHAFSDADAVRLMQLAEAKSAILLTTEKDHARLAGLTGARAELRRASRTLPISLQLDAASVARLTDLLQQHAPLRR